MLNLNISNFQEHPFHLVYPTPFEINIDLLNYPNLKDVEIGLIMGCFLLGIIIMIILLMTNNSRSNSIDTTQREQNESGNSSTKLTNKLLSQLIHNSNNSVQPLTYQNFPTNHPGYLDLSLRIKLVSIMRSSILADQYRYGSSVGTIYIKNSNDHPTVTPEMAGVVLSAELNPN